MSPDPAARPPSLELFHDGVLVFSSMGRWLHPLLELEEYLATGGPPASECRLRDRVVGRAAALLEVRLGLGEVHAALLSELGEEVFRRHGLPYSFDRRVERIACRTEELLGAVWDPEAAHRLVLERVRLAGAGR